MFKIKNTSDHPKLISPKYLINTIGFLGVALPIILIIGTWVVAECQEVQNSISAYYHTPLGDLFVGVLCAMALCFWAYEGYSPVDRLAGIIVAIFAIGVAMFPTSVGAPFNDCIDKAIDTGIHYRIHLICAVLQFLGLAFFSLFLFTKTKEGKGMDDDKKRRNRIYKTCGILIIVFMAFIGIYWLYLEDIYSGLADYKPVFWLEALCLWAFGISWFTKGGVFSKARTSVDTNESEPFESN